MRFYNERMFERELYSELPARGNDHTMRWSGLSGNQISQAEAKSIVEEATLISKMERKTSWIRNICCSEKSQAMME